MDQPTNPNKYPLHVLNEPITRSKTKAFKEALNVFFQVSAKEEIRDPLEHQEEVLVYLIHVQEGPNPTLFLLRP
jgi:hypothetical protein